MFFSSLTNCVYSKATIYNIVMHGLLALAITIGLSRFGYSTYIHQMMQVQSFSMVDIGLIGSANLLGYLVGCIFILKAKFQYFNLGAIYISVLVSILTILVSLQTFSVSFWIVIRLINGVAGGVTFIIVTVYFIEQLSQKYSARYSPVMFSGVGIGIVLSSLSTAHLEMNWLNPLQNILLIQSIFVLFLFLCMLFINHKPGVIYLKKIRNDDYYDHKIKFSFIVISYLIEGMAYIIYVTYIFPHDVIHSTQSLFATYNFAAIGLGATFSPLLLAAIGHASKMRYWVVFLFVIQLVAILSNAIVVTWLPKLISSFAFGLSFMGLTVAFIVYVKTKWPQKLTAAAVITVAYATGQAAGPIIGGLLNQVSGLFDDAIIASAIMASLALSLFYVGAFLIRNPAARQCA